MIASTIGMAFMASATDLVMLYLAIETVSIPLYILAGFFVQDTKSTESGFKYLLFGAMTSASCSMVSAALWTVWDDEYLEYCNSHYARSTCRVWLRFMSVTLVMVLVGIGFKISAVPFHFWAPDVYEGAPTPVAGFLSTASKAAGFVVLVRFAFLCLPADLWAPILAALSVVTMTLGNLVALTQHNIKRMLAYSSIAHAGYALIGVVVRSRLWD